MKKYLWLSSAAFAAFSAQAASTLNVTVKDILPNSPIQSKFAFCAPDAKTHTKDGGNVSPNISWSAGPKGTQSYAIIMHDPDVPMVFDNANKEGKTIAADSPRQEFYHWVLTDIPANVTEIKESAESHKQPGKAEIGTRGANDYGKFKGGVFAGYDGPCPPWNDEKLHHYHFDVYALDVPTLNLTGNFTGQDALSAMKSHILAQAEVIGLYSQNPKVKY